MQKTDQYICSVVIPTKNGGELFGAVLEGLRRQTIWGAVELIVVDSGSTDQTVSLAERAGATIFRIPPEQFNHGATRDFGISKSSCEKVVLMVQDAVPNDVVTLERLVAALEGENVAGAYARQLPRPEADVITKRNLNNWLTGRREREVRFIKDANWYDALSPMEKYLFCNFDNVCSALNKWAWRLENFGNVWFGEDIDWSERVLKRGFAIVYEPDAAVIHSHDRPLHYEYKRTYSCHRKLYQQFGLRLVPDINRTASSWLYATVNDIRYVIRNERDWRRKLNLTGKMPILNLLSLFGQYHGAKDEIAGVGRQRKGV
jgi:rhamnosyltransferase